MSFDPFFRATPAQERFFAAVFSGNHTVLGFGGGIRSGKSATALVLAQVLCRIFPGSRWAVVRKDLPTIKRNVLPTFSKFRVPGFMGEVNQANAWTATASNGSQIIFFPESYSEDPELNRWRGLEVNGFLLEEGNELQESSYNKAIERAGSWIVPILKVQPPPLVIVTFNPSGGWVKRTFYDPHKSGTLPSHIYFQPATILDNPHIPTAYLDSLKNLPERDYKRFVEGDWTFISGAFFDELGADSHLCDTPELPDYWTYWGGYDWGYRHPAVAMSLAQDTDGQKYLLDTIRMHRMDDEMQAAKMAESMVPQCRRLVFAGHDAFAKRQAHTAAITSPRDVMASHGVFLTKAHIQRKSGWAALRRMLSRKQPDGSLGTPELLICKTPGNLWAINQLLEMVPDDTDADDVLKIDANEDGEGGDDAADCLRYACASVPIAQTPASAQVKQDDRAVRYDWKNQRFPDKSPERLMEKLLQKDAGTSILRHRVPRNPR